MNVVQLLLFIAAGYVCLVGYVFTRPRTTATVLFQLVLVASIAWALTYYLELVLPTLESKLVPHLIRFLFIPWLSVLWLAMLRPLLGIGKGIPRWLWAGACAIAAVTMVMAVTAPYHRLFQYGFEIHLLGAGGTLGILTFKAGAWYSFYELVNTFGMCPLTIVLMLLAWRGASPIMRRQLTLLLVGYIAPVVATTLYSLGLSPIAHLNLAPFAMAVSIAALGWVVLGYRALDIVPVARGIVLDHMRTLVFVMDRQGRLVDVNQAALRIMGRTLMDCIGHTVDSLDHSWRVALQGGSEVQSVEVEGEARWFERSSLPIYDGKKHDIGRLFLLRDVTVQYNAERALRDSEEQLRLIVDNISEAVFVHRQNGELLAVNKTMLRMYGMSDEAEALRYNIARDYSADPLAIPNLEIYWDRVMEGETVVMNHWRARRPLAGEAFDVRVELHLLHRGSEKLVLATVTDITKELERQKNEQAYRLLLEEKKFARHQELLIRDLHDGVGGMMAGIGMVGALALKEKDPSRREESIRKICDLAGEGNAEVRSLMNTLETHEFFWPDLIDEMRRHGALLHDNHGIDFSLRVEGIGAVGGPGLLSGMSLFRIFKEALNNVLKHAEAHRVDAVLSFSKNQMTLRIVDDGRGCLQESSPGRGLRNMRLRMEELGGTMNVESGPGFRLCFQAPIPLKSPDQGMDESPSF